MSAVKRIGWIGLELITSGTTWNLAQMPLLTPGTSVTRKDNPRQMLFFLGMEWT
jgi:hypothetical protein